MVEFNDEGLSLPIDMGDGAAARMPISLWCGR